ncbi:MAG: glycosyl hydrolase family 79 C-terminal domain-containing protein [Solirubrobacteraceae bacterium]
MATLILVPTPLTAAPQAATRQFAPGPPLRVSAGQPAAPRIQARVVIDAHAPMRSIPASFLGISTEYWSMPLWARHLSLLDRVLSLVHGPGPLVLRIGGDSADRTFWSPVRELPGWAFELTPAWLREVSAIVRHTHARLILDLNLVTATPMIAARWARVAEAKLPKHSIIGFEIGNEPDLYSRTLWQAAIAGGRAARVLPLQITASSYAAAYTAYSRALSHAAPGVPLLGPALSKPRAGLGWISRLLATPHPGLAAVTVHRYPYSACAAASDPADPTLARVLSENAPAGMARTVLGAVRVARTAGLPVRLSELNSITCGGVSGISNTFATALWAPDALFELLHAGVSGVNVHVRAAAINAAYSLGRSGLYAHPLLYGMVMFNRMLGPDSKLVSLRLRAPRQLHLKVWAVRSGRSTLRVLVIDKGGRAAEVSLTLPAQGSATVQRLLGPSVRSARGVTLTGQRLSRNGLWRGRPVITVVPRGPRGYTLAVPRYSAAVLTVALRPTLRSGPHRGWPSQRLGGARTRDRARTSTRPAG